MTSRDRNGGFAARPRDAESWVRTSDPHSSVTVAADIYSVRLTVDITPALRGRIKIAAFQRGSPTCCAICSRASFPTSMGAARESRSQHRARAAS
jgi:hypothetical protein